MRVNKHIGVFMDKAMLEIFILGAALVITFWLTRRTGKTKVIGQTKYGVNMYLTENGTIFIKPSDLIANPEFQKDLEECKKFWEWYQKTQGGKK